MNTIATRDQLQQYLNISDGDDDARLIDVLQAATAQLERLAGRRFYPRVATIDHTIDTRHPTELLLDDDLLVLESLTSNDGRSLAIADALLIPGGNLPAGVIYLTGGNSFSWADTPKQAISVAGIWGWHDEWSSAWRESGDMVKNASFSASATTLEVNDSQGHDAEGHSPRLQVGQLIKIDAEYLRITAITVNAGDDDDLTVLRGVNGTTAATHDQLVAIHTYQPPPDIVRLCLRWAAWLYREPDSMDVDFLPTALMDEIDDLRRIDVRF